MSLIDTHCHLKPFFENNTLHDALQRARNAGVEKMITVGTSLKTGTVIRNWRVPTIIFFSPLDYTHVMWIMTGENM